MAALLDMEQVLVEKLGWSLYEIDKTAVSSLLSYIFHVSGQSGDGVRVTNRQRTYCDQVDWL